jgi:hypothetical protein
MYKLWKLRSKTLRNKKTYVAYSYILYSTVYAILLVNPIPCGQKRPIFLLFDKFLFFAEVKYCIIRQFWIKMHYKCQGNLRFISCPKSMCSRESHSQIRMVLYLTLFCVNQWEE